MIYPLTRLAKQVPEFVFFRVAKALIFGQADTLDKLCVMRIIAVAGDVGTE